MTSTYNKEASTAAMVTKRPLYPREDAEPMYSLMETAVGAADVETDAAEAVVSAAVVAVAALVGAPVEVVLKVMEDCGAEEAIPVLPADGVADSTFGAADPA